MVEKLPNKPPVVKEEIENLITKVDVAIDKIYNPDGPFGDPVDDGSFEEIDEMVEEIFEKCNLTAEQHSNFRVKYLQGKTRRNELNNFTDDLREFLRNNGVNI